MNRKLLPLLGIAFVVALIATGIFYGLIAGKLSNASTAGPSRSLVVAARNLAPGTVLETSDVKLAPWAGPEAPQGAFTAADQVVGLTVLQSMQENEPVTDPRLASREAKGGAALAIPVGMRAVSIHVYDSPGVAGLLRAGHKVDVMVIRNESGGQSPEELRTILQNVEVMTVQPEPAQGRAGPGVVLTVLAAPADAEALSLADAGGRLRILLRNPLDEERPPMPGRNLASLFHGGRAPAVSRELRANGAPKVPPPERKPAAETPAVAAVADEEVQLRLRIASAGPAALEELGARLVAPRRADQLQVSAFRPGWDLESAVQNLQARKLLEILSASYLRTGNNSQVGVLASAQWPQTPAACGVQIQFLPSIAPGGRMQLRIEPEITSPHSEGVATRKIETEVDLADGQSFLVTGLLDPRDAACGVERLFPGHDGSGRELVVLVTPKLLPSARAGSPTAALLK